MTDIMFEIPSNPEIEKCIITKDTVLESKEPEVIINEEKQRKESSLETRKIKQKKASA